MKIHRFSNSEGFDRRVWIVDCCLRPGYLLEQSVHKEQWCNGCQPHRVRTKEKACATLPFRSHSKCSPVHHLQIGSSHNEDEDDGGKLEKNQWFRVSRDSIVSVDEDKSVGKEN